MDRTNGRNIEMGLYRSFEYRMIKYRL